MNIVPRSGWGAAAPRSRPSTVQPSRRTEFYLHWNGGPLHLTDHSQCANAVLGIQRGHFNRSWADIGYNYLVCPHGIVFEGRGRDAIGAHCPGHNTSAYGVQAMIGTGETSTAPQRASILALLAELETASGHPLERHGHRDGYPTECPGRELYDWIRGAPASPSTGSGDGSVSSGVSGDAGMTAVNALSLPSVPDIGGAILRGLSTAGIVLLAIAAVVAGVLLINRDSAMRQLKSLV